MNYPYQLPQLKFAYNALEPHIDAKTMEIHHTKHHQTYIDKLNAALEKHSEFQSLSLTELLTRLDELPIEIRSAIRNNGGGHLNHSFFWEILSNEKSDPSSELLEAINKAFGSFDQFKEKFAIDGLARFGSGWVWLVKNENGELEVCSTPNQDNPVIENKTAILGLDVWEHAYYLNYQNKRGDYITAFWNLINWNKVTELYNS